MLSLPQHIASNVVKGIDPKRGVGFQTLAVSEELMGTEDLRVLEEMAPYYQASRADRQTGRLPLRELYYRLPSGNYALTRIEDWGADPHGRAGNALAHSLVVPNDAAVNTRWDPLALLDHLVTTRAADLPEPGAVPPFGIEILPPPKEPTPLELVDTWTADLLTSFIGPESGSGSPVLLIAPREFARNLIRLLQWSLPQNERKAITFATYFYRDCDADRSRFRLVTIDYEGEAPLDQNPYRVMPWNDPPPHQEYPAITAYLGRELAAAHWSDVQRFREGVDALRQGEPVSLPNNLDPLETRALFEAVGAKLAPALAGKPALINRLLDTPKPNRQLAEAFLHAGGPVQLCGSESENERGVAALRALEAAAGKQAWREWSQRWAHELPEEAAAGTRPWWNVWKR